MVGSACSGFVPRRLLLVLAVACCAALPARAEPQLRLYIPGPYSTYIPQSTDAWRTGTWVWDNTPSFELWLLGYNPNSPIENVRTSVAVPGNQTGTVTASWLVPASAVVKEG